MTCDWYAAKTKSGQDTIACNNLARQSFAIYYPQMIIERYRQGRITRETEPLFPGYILISFELDNTAWRAINNTRGVYKLLSFSEDGRPSRMPHGEVESLQDKEKQGKLYISEVLRLRRGDLVRLKFGPSTDRIGEVLRCRGERVEFLLTLLGRRSRVIAPLHALDLVGRRRVCASAEAVASR
jgi:transcriptional antiterminator RfaH